VVLLGKVRLAGQVPNKNTISRVSYAAFAYPPATCRLMSRFGFGYYWGNRGPDPQWHILRVELNHFDKEFEDDVAGQPAWKQGQWPTWLRVRRPAEFKSLCAEFQAYWRERATAEPKIARNIDKLEHWEGPDIVTQPFPRPPGAYVDFLPIGETRSLCFLVWQNQMRAWEEEIRHVDVSTRAKNAAPDVGITFIDDEEENPPRTNPKFSIAADWGEPFVVYGSPPNFLFVTDSGKLYGWHAAGTPAQKLQKHWDAAPPIRALITDYDTGKTWAFAKPDPGTLKGDAVYCLLDPETGIKNNAWKRFEFAEVKGEGLPSAVTKLLPYVKVLQDNGDIRLPKK